MFFSLLVVLVGLTVWQKRTLCSSVLQTRRKLVKPFENILARIFRITLINTRSTFREIFARVLLALSPSHYLISSRGALGSCIPCFFAYLHYCTCVYVFVCVCVCALCFSLHFVLFPAKFELRCQPCSPQSMCKTRFQLAQEYCGPGEYVSLCLCVCVCVRECAKCARSG